MSSKVSLWVFSYPNLVYNNLNTPKNVSVLSKQGDYLQPAQHFLVLNLLEHFYLLFKAISPDTVLLKYFYIFHK